MRIQVCDSAKALGKAAAQDGGRAIQAAIAKTGSASIIVATGVSQYEVLEVLVAMDIDWTKVTAFHLDEYVGIGRDHPASFRGYLENRLVKPTGGLKELVEVDGDAADLEAEIKRLNARISSLEIDVCFAGIGENCHLAFNDPPADFETEAPYLMVTLDEACRRQQMGEGWFPTLDDVPTQAISMSIRQIMKSRKIVLSAPDDRKAIAVQHAVDGPVTNAYPASIVRQHGDTSLYLNAQSASRLKSRQA